MPKRKKNKKAVTADQEPSKLMGTIDNPYGAAVCEHGMVSYKDLDKLNEKLSEGIRLRDATIDNLSRSNAFLTGMMSEWKEAQKNNIKKINDREDKWEKELEEAYKVATYWKDQYDGMMGMKKAAEAMGIDTDNYKMTEEDKKFKEKYDFLTNHRRMESGKMRYSFKLSPKKKTPQYVLKKKKKNSIN